MEGDRVVFRYGRPVWVPEGKETGRRFRGKTYGRERSRVHEGKETGRLSRGGRRQVVIPHGGGVGRLSRRPSRRERGRCLVMSAAPRRGAPRHAAAPRGRARNSSAAGHAPRRPKPCRRR